MNTLKMLLISSVQLSLRWYLCVQKSPYALHPVLIIIITAKRICKAPFFCLKGGLKALHSDSENKDKHKLA